MFSGYAAVLLFGEALIYSVRPELVEGANF